MERGLRLPEKAKDCVERRLTGPSGLIWQNLRVVEIGRSFQGACEVLWRGAARGELDLWASPHPRLFRSVDRIGLCDAEMRLMLGWKLVRLGRRPTQRAFERSKAKSSEVIGRSSSAAIGASTRRRLEEKRRGSHV